MTIAPKERGDSDSRSQAVEVLPEPLPRSGKFIIETSAVPAPERKFTGGKPYRAILNGRVELMEVLGEIFDRHFVPAFYFWFWPFKDLIARGEELRARLTEEESRSKDADQKPKFENEAEYVTMPQNDNLRPKTKQAFSVSQAHASYVEDLKPKRRDQVEMVSQKVMQAGQDATEFVHKTIDHEIKANYSPADMETERIKSDNGSQAIEPDAQTVDDTNDISLRDELRCLVTFMDTDLKDLFSVQKDIDGGTRKLIAFDHLWQLYKPGDVVISDKGQKHAYVVLHVTGGRSLQRNSQVRRVQDDGYFAKYPHTSPFVIDCFYLDFDGTNVGPLPQKFMLQEYEGEVPSLRSNFSQLGSMTIPRRRKKHL